MPHIDRVAFRLFGQPIYWYGVVIALAVALAALLAIYRERKAGVKKDTVIDFILIGVPVGFVCARLYYVAFEWRQFASDWTQIFNVRQGGIAIYGGVLGGALTAVLYCRRRKIAFGTLADIVAPSLALAQAIGRWGNFFNQEAYGAAVGSEALRFFPVAVYIEAIEEWRCATFFYESAWCLLIVALLLLAERGCAFHRRGDLFLWYALLYAAERAVVEGLRVDSLYWGPVRVSQALSILALVAGCAYLAIRAVRAGGRGQLWAFGVAVVTAALIVWQRDAYVVARQVACAVVSLALIWYGYRNIREKA